MKLKSLICCLFVLAAVACNEERPLVYEPHLLEVNRSVIYFWEPVAADSTFILVSDQEWTVDVDADWIELDPVSGEASDDPVSIKVSVTENPTEDPRTADVTVKAGDLVETVSVVQTLPPLFDLSVRELFFDAEGGEAAFTLTFTEDWRITTDDWITVSPNSGKGSRNEVEVTVTVEENTSKEERTSDIIVRIGTLAETLFLIDVKQDAAD